MIYDVAIIGAGVIGGMLARELSRYHISVCLLEKENDVAMGSSKANSGIIHGGYDPEPGTLKAKLNAEGVELLFQAAEELNVPYRRNGSMVCAFSPEEVPLLEELYRRGQRNGIQGLELLSGEEARILEPQLSPEAVQVLHVTNSGIIGPYELTIAAVGNAMDNGVILKCNFDVVSIVREQDIFVITSGQGEQVKARYLVNCAGGYSDKIAALAGDDFFRIIPRAGEYLLLDKSEGSRVGHTLFQCPTKEGKGILVTPTVHGNLLTGPTARRVASPDSRETTSEGISQVQRLAAKSVPNVDFRQVITSFTGVRSSEEKGDFLLRASDNIPGLIHAAAIDSPGLSCCVSIARYLVDILRREGLCLELIIDWDGRRRDPCAFQKMRDEDKDAYIKQNPAFGKIVCRCEMISEGEIIQAIRSNPPARDMDGIKRRTRSGMGRCQGGFCGPYVMELLARELEIPMEQVTKSGRDSRMILGRIGDAI